MNLIREKGIEELGPCIEQIENDKLKSWVVQVLEEDVPDYFFYGPASSSGRHHPLNSLGLGGLLRHTRAAVKVAKELEVVYRLDNMIDKEWDCIIAALILHDICKPAKDHADLAFESLKNYGKEAKVYRDSFESRIQIVRHLILTHMGQWGDIHPVDEPQKFVHLCDYIASRRDITINIRS